MAEIYHTASEIKMWLDEADLRPQDEDPTKISARLNMIDTDPDMASIVLQEESISQFFRSDYRTRL